MSTNHPLVRHLVRYPAVAVLSYVAIVAACVVVTWMALANIYERRAALAAAIDMLDQLEGRKASPGGPGLAGGGAPPGSPFLEGPTVTVAGAALQERVTSAVTKLGGNVLSSQVDLQGTQAKNGFVSLTASCEVEQPALQKLLYDLEAGMPFLFVDQLEVEPPQTGTAQEGGRMRVLLSVSGQWQGAK
jgi:general secretion pathway protein M